MNKTSQSFVTTGLRVFDNRLFIIAAGEGCEETGLRGIGKTIVAVRGGFVV